MKRPNLTALLAVSGVLWFISAAVVLFIATASITRAQWQIEVLLISAIITLYVSSRFLIRNYKILHKRVIKL